MPTTQKLDEKAVTHWLTQILLTSQIIKLGIQNILKTCLKCDLSYLETIFLKKFVSIYKKAKVICYISPKKNHFSIFSLGQTLMNLSYVSELPTHCVVSPFKAQSPTLLPTTLKYWKNIMKIELNLNNYLKWNLFLWY